MCSGSGVRGKWTSEQAFQQINSLLDQLSGEALRRLRRFDSGQGYANSLALSAKGWLSWKCNLTYPAASNQVEVARALESLPQTSKALADGDISYRHASLIARTSEQLGDRMEAHAEEILVTAAKKLDRRACARSPRTFVTACSQMKCFETPTKLMRSASFI